MNLETTMIVKYLTVAFLFLNLLTASFFWRIIFRHISKKPILSVTLVDLIYRDTILYILALTVSFSAGIVHTLADDLDVTFSLDLEYAFGYSVAINIATNLVCLSLMISALLRLITLVENNEAAGSNLIFVAKIVYCQEGLNLGNGYGLFTI